MQTIIDESVEIAAEFLMVKMGKSATTLKKLQAVIAARKNGIKKVSEVLNIGRASIYLWTKQIKSGDFEKLVNKPKLKDGIKIKKPQKDKIALWLKDNPNLTIKEVQAMIKEKFNIEASKSTIHRAMHRCGFSYITPRQNHYKQDKEKVEKFKKKLQEQNQSG